MRLVFVIGLPGTGKTTVGRKLAKQYKLPFVSAGEWIRREMRRETALGRRMKKAHDTGRLNDLGDLKELFISKIFTNLKGSKKIRPEFSNGFVLEGFPRSLAGLELLESIFGKQLISMAEFYHLFTPVRTAVERMLFERKRADDVPEVVARKIAIFKERTFPLVLELKHRGQLIRVKTVHADRRSKPGTRSVGRETAVERTLELTQVNLKKMRAKKLRKQEMKRVKKPNKVQLPKRRPRA